MVVTLLLVRHGDRFDYGAGKQAWKERCKRQQLEPSDPPLSGLGHAQAREVAAFLTPLGPTRLLVSPYLRALQTAQPLAHLTSLPLCVDFALAEAHQKPAVVPPLASRAAFLPEISESYAPMLPTVVTHGTDGKEPGVEPRLEHLRRMLFLARELSSPAFEGETIVCVSHAATLALVAALTESATLAAVGKLAPCGVCKLVREGGVWRVVQEGHDNSAYVTSNAETTFPWGFVDSSCAIDETEATWQEALRLGPTNVADLSAESPMIGAQGQAAATGGGGEGFYDPN